MKVLFAVSNENISESIVKKYQREYKEIISYKNVYYFNAILKEIQKDKSYDRIVISEDLEPFANNNYDAIDKFLFEKLDSISDEATNSDRNDTPIILICTDRRSKSEEILVKLFSIGIYDAVIGQDRSIDEICRLIKTPRTKKEAKIYYKIDTDDVNYKSENEDEVSEIEIQNILTHYKRLGKNEEKYVESFNNIASQYTDEQLRVIAGFLPLNVRAVLEEKSAKYQQIITSMGGKRIVGRTQEIEKERDGIKVNFLETKNGRPNLNRPVVIPTSVDTNNVKKLNKKIKEEVRKEEAILEKENQEEQEELPKKRRGRPRKNPIPEVEDIEKKENEVEEITQEPPKKKRGRPRKNPIPEVIEKKEEPENINLFDLSEEDDEDEIENIQDSDYILPGLDNNSYEDEDEEEEYEKKEEQRYESYNNNQYDNEQQYSYNKINETSYEPTFSKDITKRDVDYNSFGEVENLLTRDKKLVSFVGTSKNGTSFLVNNVAEMLSTMGIDTAILDATVNRNAFYIYTKNEEELRKVASESIPKLRNGIAQGIRVNKNLSVYTSVPEENVGIEDYESILATLVQNHSLVLIDCDFNTNLGYFAKSQELYLVQSMDVLTIQPLTAFLRELKAKNILTQDKIRIVVNKTMKVKSLTIKTIIGGMSYYNDPAMSFMTELFNRDTVKYQVIPFEEQTYTKYLEGLVNCKISLNGYSKQFMQALKELGNVVYPLIGGKQAYKPVESYGNSKFSSNMNNTLNQMKKNY